MNDEKDRRDPVQGAYCSREGEEVCHGDRKYVCKNHHWLAFGAGTCTDPGPDRNDGIGPDIVINFYDDLDPVVEPDPNDPNPDRPEPPPGPDTPDPPEPGPGVPAPPEEFMGGKIVINYFKRR